MPVGRLMKTLPKTLLDVAKRNSVLALSVLVTVALVLMLAVDFTIWKLLFLIASTGLMAVCIFDIRQTRSTLARNFPGLAHGRDFLLFMRPYLRQYIVEGDKEGRPFDYEARDLIYKRANGDSDTHPFGTERKLDREETSWMAHSIIPAVNVNTNPRITIGEGEQAYSASVLNISAMSLGSLSEKAVESMNLGARKGGFFQDTGEGGLSEWHLKHGGDVVFEIGTGYFGCRDENGDFDPKLFAKKARHPAVKMTELKLSQGAKPGYGGAVPAAKMTQNVARTRQMPAHEKCQSPATHSAFATPVELLKFIDRMRTLSGGKPVGIKLCVGLPHEIFALIKAMRSHDIYPDYIVVDGAEGGTGGAPVEFSDWVGMPLEQGLAFMRNALVGAGLRERIKLGASGRVYSGAGMMRCLAIGADWCNAARAFMLSIGCVQAQRCHTNKCPTGVTSMDPHRQKGIVVEEQAERVRRFHSETVKSLTDLVAAAGLSHPSELRPFHLAKGFRETGFTHFPSGELILDENILLNDPESTPYSSYWQAASPDSFSPVSAKGYTQAISTRKRTTDYFQTSV